MGGWFVRLSVYRAVVSIIFLVVLYFILDVVLDEAESNKVS